MLPPVSLRIPQPCHENWAAMTPTAAGRHCATCQQTVVDFTHQSDAEILAYLARAAGARTCGRFAAGQLERPLQRAAPAAPTRWRAWLAAALAVWGLREVGAAPASAQVLRPIPPRYWGGPVPTLPVVENREAATDTGKPVKTKEKRWEAPIEGNIILRGVITDASTGERLPGVTVLLPGTKVGTSTDQDGAFELVVAPKYIQGKSLKIQVSSVGFETKQIIIKRKALVAQQAIKLTLELDTPVKGGLAILHDAPPSAGGALSFWNHGLNWLTRSFRQDQTPDNSATLEA